jgi:hypothetical protein
VYDPAAVAVEETLTTARQEYRMRVRVSLRAWWALWDVRAVLNVRRYGILSLQVFSHKVLRYLACAALPAAYVAAIVLSHTAVIYAVAAVSASILLVVAGSGAVLERLGRPAGAAAIPYYFLLINAAAAHALVRFVRGQRQMLWAPRLG